MPDRAHEALARHLDLLGLGHLLLALGKAWASIRYTIQPVIDLRLRQRKRERPMQLCQRWAPFGGGLDPTGYFIAEKLDGVRALWEAGELRCRSGRLISAPRQLLGQLPSAIDLDGELFLGRGEYEQCCKIVLKKRGDIRQWKAIRFMVFDAPGIDGPFAARLDAARAALSGCPWGEVLEQTQCTCHQDVSAAMDRVHQLGGEGVVLRHPTAPYTFARNTDMVKYKHGYDHRYDDAEATVLGWTVNATGLMNALQVASEHGPFEISTGFTAAQREQPPPPGTVVTYWFQRSYELLPLFPVFARIRPAE